MKGEEEMCGGIVEEILGAFEEVLRIAEQEEEMRQQFRKVFGVEPEEVTTKYALRRAYLAEKPAQRAEKILDTMELSTDFDRVYLLMEVRRGQKNVVGNYVARQIRGQTWFVATTVPLMICPGSGYYAIAQICRKYDEEDDDC